jgi:hypothetical protein
MRATGGHGAIFWLAGWQRRCQTLREAPEFSSVALAVLGASFVINPFLSVYQIAPAWRSGTRYAPGPAIAPSHAFFTLQNIGKPFGMSVSTFRNA